MAPHPPPGSLDEAPWEQLLAEHRSRVLAYILAVVQDPHDAEDLLQEVCLAAVRSAEQYRPGTSYGAWIREIARRRILDYAKRLRRRPPLLDSDVLDRLEGPARRLDEQPAVLARERATEACLEKLSGISREVVDLRYGQSLRVGVVADRIGRTLHATYALLKRVRQILRRCVDESKGR